MTTRPDTRPSRPRGGPGEHRFLPDAAETSALLAVYTVLGIPLGVMQLLVPLVGNAWLAAAIAVTTPIALGAGYLAVVRLKRRWHVLLPTWVVVTVAAGAAAIGWLSGFLAGGGR